MLRLLKLVCRESSLAEIRTYIERVPTALTTQECDGISEEARRSGECSANMRNYLMDVERLSDDPIIKVPAKPWTNITGDDAFVSHLVSLYFTWHGTFFNFVERDRFVSGMQSSDLDSRYCSPLLVNAVLAEACVCLKSNGDGTTRLTCPVLF